MKILCYQMITKGSLVLWCGILLASTVYGQGASEEHRRVPFTVFSDDAGLRTSLGVRHQFPGVFTTNLTLAEAHELNLLGIQTQGVVLYHPTKPPGKCDPWPECKNGGGDDGGSTADPARAAVPNDQTPWGIEEIYNDAAISSTFGGSGVNVAVLDTGVKRDHLDLIARVAQCVDFTGGPPGASRINEGKCDDKNGHGTHVAGTVLADGGWDGLGIFGIAPEASLLAYRVCGGGGCWGDDIAAAIDYAGTHGAHIVSMSLGGDRESSLIRDAISRNLDLLIVAAAGNDGPDIGSIDYPGANVNVIAVGAIDSFNQVASWSSRGINPGQEINVIERREVELAAPGVSVESTWNNGAYNVISGTSMATPHVTGLAAKVWQGNSNNTRLNLQGLAPGKMADDPATGFGVPQLP